MTNQLCIDPEGDPLDVRARRTPGKGTAVVVASPSNGILYTPNPGESGEDTFRIDVTDNMAGGDGAASSGNNSNDVTIKIIIKRRGFLPAILHLLLGSD